MSNITPYFYGSDDLIGSTRVRTVVTYISSSLPITASYTPSSIDSENGIVYFTSSILPSSPINTTNLTISITPGAPTPQDALVLVGGFSAIASFDTIIQYTYQIGAGPTLQTITDTIILPANNSGANKILVGLASATPSSPAITYAVPNVQVEFKYEKDVFYEGDSSYGKTAAVDRNSNKIGWVKNITSQSLNFFDKTQIQLKYLVDVNQNLTELNLRNENIFEVQNTFKSGDRVVVSLSDVVKPTFQKSLDGTKTIFKGGFSYDPILYRENLETLRFTITSGSSTLVPVSYRGYGLGWVEQKRNSEYSYNNNDTGDPSNPSVGPNPEDEKGYAWATVKSSQINKQSLTEQEWLSNRGNAMATRYTAAEWDSKISSVTNNNVKKLIDFNLPTTGRGLNQYGIATLYAFENSCVSFDVTSDASYPDAGNTFQTALSELVPPDGIFKAPALGTYNIKLRVPWGLYQVFGQIYRTYDSYASMVNNPLYTSNFNFKIFGVLERLPNTANSQDDSSWEIVAVAKTKFPLFNFVGDIPAYAGGYDESYNLLWTGTNNYSVVNQGNRTLFRPPQKQYIYAGHAGFTELCSLKNPNQSTVQSTLGGGDILRFRFCIIDFNEAYKLRSGLSGFINGEATRFLDLFIGSLQGSNIKYEHAPYNYSANGVPRENFWNSTNSGEWSKIANKTKLPKSYFEISNPAATVISSEKFKNINGNIFEEDKTDASTILLDSELVPLVEDESVFTPVTSSTTFQYYTEVIDEFGILPEDLIRFGPFNSLDSTYSTVKSVELIDPIDAKILTGQDAMFLYNADSSKSSMAISDTSTTLSGLDRSTITVLATPENIAFFNGVLKTNSRKFKINQVTTQPNYASYVTAISPHYNTEYEIKEIVQQELLYFPNRTRINLVFGSIFSNGTPTILTVLRIVVSEANSNVFPWGNARLGSEYIVSYTNTALAYSNVTFDSWGGVNKYSPSKLITTTFESVDPIVIPPYYKIILNNELPKGLNINEDFAILRPKPDETSVIIDFKKKDGNVSQTILVPIDASENIKSKLGDIFASLNTDLSNTNDFSNLL
jgi:hypothetical protein